MTDSPDTVYARSGDVRLAYRQFGKCDPAVLFVPTAIFPIDLLFDDPIVATQLGRLASFSRLIMTDLLGVGSSDRVSLERRPAMQTWSDGLLAVLDATGVQRASLFATAETALPVLLLAASHPDRVRSLILWAPFARYSRAPDYPWGMPALTLHRYLDSIENDFGTGVSMARLAPSWSPDPAKLRWWARNERLAAGPGYFKTVYELYMQCDVRAILPSIQAPTLIMNRRGDMHVRDGHARFIAESIPGARLIQFDGADHVWLAGDPGVVLDEVESFVTGQRPVAPANRVLATVLVTDIVGSTERAASLGDTVWTSALRAHDEMVEQNVAKWRGVVVKFTGDGVLATFDGPARAIQCANMIRDAARGLNLEIRAGLHTGEIETSAADVHGIGVHIAARIAALAAPGEVLVSGTVPPLVLGSNIVFKERGSHQLRGVPGSWPLLSVQA